MKKFCIHPETSEFFGDDTSENHAHQIAQFGSRPFQEYLRLAYMGRSYTTGQPLDAGVLLTRAFYNPDQDKGPYDPIKDKEVTLGALALVIKNGLPNDTRIFPSADRQKWEDFGLK